MVIFVTPDGREFFQSDIVSLCKFLESDKKLSLHKLSKLRKREPYYWEPGPLILYVETEIDNCPDERLKSVARYALKKRHYKMMSESLVAMIHVYLTIFEKELQ